MPTLSAFAFLAIGIGIGAIYIKLVERSIDRQQAQPDTTPNDLQRAVYEPEDAPRPLDRPRNALPVKRGPGPRKTEVATEQYVGGGTRHTRSFATPIRETRRVSRHKIN